MDYSRGNLTLEEVVKKDITELLGAEAFSEEEKAGLYEKMLETIRLRAFERFDDTLKDIEREEFKKILDEGNDEEVKQFYASKDFDFEKVMVEEALKYKIELTAYADFIKKSGASLAELKEKLSKGSL